MNASAESTLGTEEDGAPFDRNAAAHSLHGAGLHPVPLPYGQKNPPQADCTGYDGRNLTEAEITRRDWSNNSIAVRMPATVIGLDVDAYNGGNSTLAGLVAEYGPLPKTVMTTARSDGSGIRFYRVPAGTSLQTAIPGGIELIQWFHRYAVVAPSTNPKVGHAPYQWIDEASGEALGGPPDVDALPELPWAWIGGLANRGNGKKADRLAGATEIREFFDNNSGTNHPAALRGIESKLEAAGNAPGGRHDTAVKVACWAMREARAGLYPAVEAVGRIAGWWDIATAGEHREGELSAIIVWAISEALAEDQTRIDEIRQQAERDFEEWADQQRNRRRSDMAVWLAKAVEL